MLEILEEKNMYSQVEKIDMNEKNAKDSKTFREVNKRFKKKR